MTTAPPKADPGRVLDLAPDDILTPPGNRPVTPDSVGDLLPSIEAAGQRIPGIVYPHPEQPGKYLCAAGNRRVFCCRILGRSFKAVLLSEPPSEVELIRTRLTENVIRKAMSADEIARDIERYMEVAKATQEQAAEFFGFSKSYVSKLLAPSKRLSPDLHHLHENPAICRDVIRIIAGMPTPDQQRQLAEKVLATIKAGGTVKRDIVERWAAGMKGKRQPKAAPFKVRIDGAVATLPGDWSWDRVIELGNRLVEVGKRGTKIEVPPALAMPSLLKS